jgi:HEPN domain-containing protein
MQKLTAEWVRKAEGDWHSALRELRARKNPNHDAACFHAQQCAEKYLKARLQDAVLPFPKTHDLANLLDRLRTLEPSWAHLRPDLDRLTAYAVEVRYPAVRATKAAARDAVGICREVRTLVRHRFGLRG